MRTSMPQRTVPPRTKQCWGSLSSIITTGPPFQLTGDGRKDAVLMFIYVCHCTWTSLTSTTSLGQFRWLWHCKAEGRAPALRPPGTSVWPLARPRSIFSCIITTCIIRGHEQTVITYWKFIHNIKQQQQQKSPVSQSHLSIVPVNLLSILLKSRHVYTYLCWVDPPSWNIFDVRLVWSCLIKSNKNS
jgi:hypothetical protein